VRARGGDTGRSVAFDEARGTTGWPARVDGRGVFNTTVREFVEARDASPEAVRRRMERYRQADLEGDVDRIVTWAGTGVGSMHDILPAEEVVKQITQETLEALARVGQWVHPASSEL
jgi:nitronate monooxygenase